MIAKNTVQKHNAFQSKVSTKADTQPKTAPTRRRVLGGPDQSNQGALLEDGQQTRPNNNAARHKLLDTLGFCKLNLLLS